MDHVEITLRSPYKIQTILKSRPLNLSISEGLSDGRTSDWFPTPRTALHGISAYPTDYSTAPSRAPQFARRSTLSFSIPRCVHLHTSRNHTCDWRGDSYEPNDVEAYTIDGIDGTVHTLDDAYIHPSVDKDIFRFYVEDGFWDWFNVTVTLTDVPSTVDLDLQLLWVEDADGVSHGVVATSDEGGLGDDEELNFREDIGWESQTGWYEVVVSSAESSSCLSSYTLSINANNR